MNFCRRRFNLYFFPAAVWLLLSGCALWHHEQSKIGILRIHMESEATAAGSNQSISVLRTQPVSVNISTDPILTEADLVGARIVNASGGSFNVELKFEEIAGWRLEQSSSANPGKHLAIFAQWPDKPGDDKKAAGRWLAAPLILRRIATATLVFAPDASREEMDKWVAGLNLAAQKNAGRKSKQ